MPDISVEMWLDPPLTEVLRNLTGRVLNVCVGGEVGPDPVPFGEFFRFARVIGVVTAPVDPGPFSCARCGRTAGYRITVEWEVGYECPDGNDLCEHCISGIVTSGADAIPFGNEQTGDVTYHTSMSIDLRKKQ